MNFSTKKTIGALFCLGASLFGASCATSENSNANQANQTNAAATAQTATKDDVEELGKIVRLPLSPVEATFRQENGGKKLTAVLKFSASDAANLVAQAGRHQPPSDSAVDAEDWFPAELVAQSQLSGDETLRGASFAANDFFQAPFESGKLTRVGETDYFILELAAP